MKRNRRLAAFQRQQHRAEVAELATENASLEGQLMARFGLDEAALEQRIGGGEYLDPWERRRALLELSAQAQA